MLHEKLTSVIPKINSSLTFQVRKYSSNLYLNRVTRNFIIFQFILYSMNILITNILVLHSIIQDCILKNADFKNLGITLAVGAGLMFIIYSIPIRTAVSITDQTQKLGFLVNRAMIQTDQKSLKKLLLQFSDQINQRNVPICNSFFNIDWKHLYSVGFIGKVLWNHKK